MNAPLGKQMAQRLLTMLVYRKPLK